MVILRSVKNWLTLLVVGLVALAMLVAWAYVVPPLGSRLESLKLSEMAGNADEASVTVSTFTSYDSTTGDITIRDQDAIDQVIARLGMKWNARVVLVDRGDTVRADSSGTDPFDTGDYPVFRDALRTGVVEQGIQQTASGRYAVTAVPLLVQDAPGAVAGVVLVLTPLDDVDRAVASVQRQLLLATALALLVALVASYVVSTFVAARLKRIEASAETISAGDLSVNVPVGIEDEVGQLAGAFNSMAGRLREAFDELAAEKNRIEILLNDLSEGVIGISADGHVTITNPAAAELLGRQLPVGAELGSGFPYEVANMWYESRRGGDVHEVVFMHGERTIEASTYPVGGEADFTSIIVLRDVTAQAKLERARRDFIANASHEFKTPLFSLAGFLEILDEGSISEAERHEFLQLMRQQVDRLRNLAVSMLDLSRVEAGSIELAPGNVELQTVARSVLDEFQTQAQAKQLAMAVENGGDPVTAWCDEDRLAQVLRALVDNAVKFSPPRSSVSIRIGEDARTATLAVSDTGPGIPTEDLPRVFERFHRGRQERASTSGAGLGLSIARELTELMGGTIAASSPDGGGAVFTVRLLRRQPRGRPRRRPGGPRA